MPSQTLRDARREGRLREELSDQAKESRGRLRGLWRKYGAVGIGCYFSIYFGSIAIFYGVYDYGVMTTLPSGGAAVIERVSRLSSGLRCRVTVVVSVGILICLAIFLSLFFGWTFGLMLTPLFLQCVFRAGETILYCKRPVVCAAW